MVTFHFVCITIIQSKGMSLNHLFNTPGILSPSENGNGTWILCWLKVWLDASLGCFIAASTLTHNWSQLFPPYKKSTHQFKAKISRETQQNSTHIDSTWSVGWNRWMCGYKICLEHPIRINRLGNYFFWAYQVARFWGCFSWSLQPIWKICSSNWILSKKDCPWK